MYGDELSPDLRDPRLSQTICMPGQDLRPNGEFVFKLPPLNEESRNQNTTGYSILKYVEYNTTYIPNYRWGRQKPSASYTIPLRRYFIKLR